MGRFGKWLGLIAVGLTLSACAVGNKHQYAATPLELDTVGSSEALALSVQDQRPYVRDGDKEADFVGVQRGGFGNPFDVTTESRKPLADDFAAAITAALKKSGTEAKVVPAPVNTDLAAVLGALRQSGAGRAILLALREWKADTYTNTALLYDVTLTVYDGNGKLRAEKSVKGDEDLGGSMMNPPAHAKTAVPKAFARIIADLINAPEIQSALK